MTLANLQGQIKKIDEYEYFSKIIKSIYANSPGKAKALVSGLSDVQQSYLKGILQSKRIAIGKKGDRTTIARRILRPKIAKTTSSMH